MILLKNYWIIKTFEGLFLCYNKGKVHFKRDSYIRDAALKIASFKCEFCEIEGFLKNDGTKYAEGHHLMPMSHQKNYNILSLDHSDNIFCLCSNCHSKIHHINDKDKLNMILTLYSKKSEFYRPNS